MFPPLLTRPCILASASPRRAELLAQIGLACRVQPGQYDEPPPAPGDNIIAYLRRVAAEKARAASRRLADAPALILSADTLVLAPAIPGGNPPRLHGIPVTVMGKPVDADHAGRMLAALSGRTHTVASAFCLCCHPEGEYTSEVVETRVTFRTLTDEEIRQYVATGEPLDKAGAYGIQGYGAVLVERIVGDYNAVVGLPLARLWECLHPFRQT